MLTRISLHNVIHTIPGNIRQDLRRSPLDSTFVRIKTESWVKGWELRFHTFKALVKESDDVNPN